MDAKPFSDEESLGNTDPTPDPWTIEDILRFLNHQLPLIVVADRKRIEELEKEMRERTRLWHNAGIEVKQRAATIERLRGVLEQVQIHIELHPNDWPRSVHDKIERATALCCPECGSDDIYYDRSVEVDDDGNEEQVKHCNKCGTQIRQALETKEES